MPVYLHNAHINAHITFMWTAKDTWNIPWPTWLETMFKALGFKVLNSSNNSYVDKIALRKDRYELICLHSYTSIIQNNGLVNSSHIIDSLLTALSRQCCFSHKMAEKVSISQQPFKTWSCTSPITLTCPVFH